MDASQVAAWLRDATADAEPGPAWVYRPLEYAWGAHDAYSQQYGGPKRLLLVGMNPGHWGMGQTGIPFGDPPLVGDWLGLRGTPVHPPATTHPKRPVLGWASTRREASGTRLWGHLRARHDDPQRALRDLFVVNHCPLLMFNEAGTNITPDKLPKSQRDPLLQTCDAGIARLAEATGATALIGVGAYAKARCDQVAEAVGAETAQIPHPSPASPLANRDGGAVWRRMVDEVLDAFDA